MKRSNLADWKVQWREEKNKFHAAKKQAKRELKQVRREGRHGRRNGQQGFERRREPENPELPIDQYPYHHQETSHTGQQTGVITTNAGAVPTEQFRGMSLDGQSRGFHPCDVGPLGETRGTEKSEKAREAGY